MDPENPILNAIEESLPSDVVTDSSTVEAPVVTPTPKVEQEVPFHEHPRWKERQAELERERQEKAYWQQQAQSALDLAKRQNPVPVEDPYAGIDPAERQAWERIEKVAERIADKRIQQKEEVWAKEVQQTKEAMAVLAYKEFQKAHPDVAPGSPEEDAIANLINRRYDPEDAYKVVMYEKNAQKAAHQVKQQVNVKTQQKIAANLETQTIPASNGLPKSKKEFRAFMDEELRKNGW